MGEFFSIIIVGINFMRDFLGGSTEKSLVEQVRHALYLGAAGQYCLGADYFAVGDIPPEMQARINAEATGTAQP